MDTNACLYARLSQQELRGKVDPESLLKIQKKMQEFLTIFKQKGIQYIGPLAEKIKDTSIVEQIRVCFELAQKEKWTIHSCVVDYDISGASYTREGFDHIITWAKEKTINLVVLKDLDRFARDVSFQETNWLEFKDWGCSFRFVYNNEQAQDEFLRPLFGVLNQRLVQKGREDYARRVDYCTKEKIPFVDPPWGYKWNRKRDNWVFDDKEIKRVFEIFADFLRGVYYKETCQRLGIVHQKYYQTLLKVRAYAGYVVWYQKQKKGYKRIVEGSALHYYEGSHPKLLSDSVLNAVLKKQAEKE